LQFLSTTYCAQNSYLHSQQTPPPSIATDDALHSSTHAASTHSVKCTPCFQLSFPATFKLLPLLIYLFHLPSLLTRTHLRWI
jgi:hypothetical protein